MTISEIAERTRCSTSAAIRINKEFKTHLSKNQPVLRLVSNCA
jgi:hypothetical protein